MQPAGDLHHQIGDAFFGQAQHIFDNATAFDAGNHVLDLNPDAGDHLVEELIGWLSSWPRGFFWVAA